MYVGSKTSTGCEYATYKTPNFQDSSTMLYFNWRSHFWGRTETNSFTRVIITDTPLTYFLTYSMEQSPSWEANQLAKKFPAFHGTRRFTSAFTSARHLSLSSVRSIQSMPQSQIFKFHFNVILPPKPGSSKWSPSLRSPHPNPVRTSPLPHTCYMPRPSHYSWFGHPIIFGEEHGSLTLWPRNYFF